MKLRLLLMSLVLIITLGFTAQSTYIPSSDWETIAEGIEYREYRLHGPNRVFVARMDRSNPNVILESSIAQGTLAQGKETVSGMANRYDQAINAWTLDGNALSQPIIPIGAIVGFQEQFERTWGARNNVIVAINGEPVSSFDDLLVYIALESSPGSEVILTILRNGEFQDITVKLDPRPDSVESLLP